MTDCGMRKASRSISWSTKSVFGIGIGIVLALCGALASSHSAIAQAANAASISLGPILTSYGTPASNAPARVCPLSSIGTPCPTAGVVLYSNYNLTGQPLPNPTTLNSQGILNVFSASGSYLVQVTPVATQPQNVYTFYIISSGSGAGFPITLGSTPIPSGSTTNSVNGLAVNGVNLSSTGSASLFLNQAGGYTAPPSGGTGSSPQAAYFNATNTISSAPGSIVLPLGASNITPQGTNFGAFTNKCEYNIPGGGQITKIVPLFFGHGYLSPPNLTITGGGGGTGLSLTPVLGGTDGSQVVSYTINNPGSGYTGCPTVQVSAPPANAAPVSVTDYRQGPNATQAINNVDTFGAVGDGSTDDSLALQAAIVYATKGSTAAGTISLNPNKNYHFSGNYLSGYFQTGFDDGTAPATGTCTNRNIANGIGGTACTQIAPETPGYIGYILNSASEQQAGLTIDCNGATLSGPFNPTAAAGTNLGLLDLPTTVGTMASPYVALFGGNMTGMKLKHCVISNFFIGALSLTASQQNFDDVTFNNGAVSMYYENAQLSTWNNITTNQMATPLVLGGYWACGNVSSSCINGFNIFDASVFSNVNFNGLNFDTTAHFVTAMNNLNTWFDNYFYHSVDNYNRWSDQTSASLTPGGCTAGACISDYVGIYGAGYSMYARQGRVQVFPQVINLNSRSANNYEVVMTFPFQPTVNVGSGETAAVCNNNASIIFGSATCPNLYNYSANQLFSPVYMWRETFPTVTVTGGVVWSTTVSGPTNLSDAVNSGTMKAVGFTQSGGAVSGANDAGYYNATAAVGISGNNFFGLSQCSIASSGKNMCAVFNAYNYFTGTAGDFNSYFYDVTGNFLLRQQAISTTNAQAGMEVPGLRIRPQNFAGAQGGNLTSATITNAGSGYAALAKGTVTITGCIKPATATWFSNAAGNIITIKVTYGGFGCTSANPPVLVMPASSGTTATLSPVINTLDETGFVSDFGSKRFNLLTTPVVIPAGNTVQVTGVTIPGLAFGGGIPPFQASVPFMVYEPGSGGFTGLNYTAIATGTNTATVTINNNTSGSLTAPTGQYAAIWAASEPISLITPPAASGTVGTVAPRYINATNSTGAGTMTGSATTATHTFATTFGSTPNCQVTPTSNSGGYWISTQNTTTLTVTYITSGAQTFNALCLGSGGAW